MNNIWYGYRLCLCLLNHILECLNEVGLPLYTHLVLYIQNHAYAVGKNI